MGDPPVPSGHWPGGMERTSAWKTETQKSSGASPIPSGESPLGTGGSPVLPGSFAGVISDFGFNPACETGAINGNFFPL